MKPAIQSICLTLYALFRRTGLPGSRLGQSIFVPAYFLYKRFSEAPWIDLLGSLARPGSLAVDVGANIGFFTLPLSRAVGPDGQVLAFEPDAANRSLLERGLRRGRCANVEVVAAALGDRDGTVDLHLNADNPADHRIFPGAGHTAGPSVALCRLDSFLARNPPGRKLSLVKIDVQGAELLALRGMRQTLADSPEARLILEFCPEALSAGGTSPAELLDFLRELGFSAYVPKRGCAPVPLDWPEVIRRGCAAGYIDLLLSRQDF
ncbi:MAG: FkbM family methyltransferase [Elusimicrobiota bacterium]|jgi:FkbM family methyltransferase